MEYADKTALKGKWAYDSACLANDAASCASDFHFITITEQAGLQIDEDGILGMWSGFGETGPNHALYVPWLLSKGVIDEATFSWYMTGLSGTTYIDFGAPDASIIGDGTAIQWFDAKSDSVWWTNTISALKWGELADEPDKVVTYTAKDALIDTGTSCLIGPQSEMDDIYNSILGKVSYYVEHPSWKHLFWCTEKANMPKFSLNLGGYWFEMTPDDYAVEVGTGACAMCL